MLGTACFLFFPFLASSWNLGLSVGLPSSWKPLQKLSHRHTQEACLLDNSKFSRPPKSTGGVESTTWHMQPRAPWQNKAHLPRSALWSTLCPCCPERHLTAPWHYSWGQHFSTETTNEKYKMWRKKHGDTKNTPPKKKPHSWQWTERGRAAPPCPTSLWILFFERRKVSAEV